MVEPIGGAPKILQSKEVGSKSGMDKKQKKQLVMLAFLIPFFLYLVYSTFFSGPEKAKPTPSGVQTADAAAAPVQPVRRTLKPQSGEKEAWGRSPFSLRGGGKEDEAAQQGPLQLQGIVFDDLGSAYAIVNRKIVKVGDRIADNTVKGIRADEVIFQSDEGVRITLRS